MPRSALLLTLAAACLAALAVAGQRVGLALSLTLLLVLAAAARAAGGGGGGSIGGSAAPSESRSPRPLLLALGAGLALQPALRDASWVVVVDVAAALVAGAAALVPGAAWRDVRAALTAPLRLAAGSAVVARAARAGLPELAGARTRHGAAVLRGVVAAGIAVAAFGGLFAAADPAFAEVAGNLVTYDGNPAGPLTRLGLAVSVLVATGALARAAVPRPAGPASWVPARTELLVVLGALAALFALWVGVQVLVLFGGAAYVQRTTGLGYGEYARQGFGALLAVAGLTLALVAVAARRRERPVRALLGVLCALTLVVLVSAHHRLALVEQAYGLTRPRFAGHVVVVWLGAVVLLVLAAGAHRRVASLAPRVVLPASLAALLVVSLANPDGRIAGSAVARFERTGQLDEDRIALLSADALPALERLPARFERDRAALRQRLARPDGLAGLNLARARARGDA